MSRTEQLISEYLDGRLDPTGTDELARSLARDSAVRQEFIELYRQHQILSGPGVTSTETMFVQTVLADLQTRKRNHELDPKAPRFSRLQNFWSQFISFCRPSLAGRLAAAGALALLMVGGWFLIYPSRPLSAMVIHSSAGTTVVRDGKNLACYEGFRLKTGDGLQTLAAGTAVVQYLDEQTTLHLNGNAQLFFRYAKRGKRLNLTAGEVSVVAGHQPTNAPMIFITPKAEADVVGTRFLLAARRFSTWLEVSQGTVAFKRNAGVGRAAETADSTSDSGPVLVKAGEYAVAADGIPLKKYPVTDLLNLAHPLPLNIDWYGYYGQPYWYVHPPYVQQVQPTNTFRTFHLPAVRGSILLTSTIDINSAKAGLTPAGNGAGFAVGLSAETDCFLACVQWKDGHPVLEIVDANRTPLDEVPVSISSWPVCQLKFELERSAGQQVVVRAKVWSGSDEPPGWQLSKMANLQETQDKFELRLLTQESACTFENTSAFLVE